MVKFLYYTYEVMTLMDKLVEFLTSKIGYTLAVIGGLLIPGMLFIFVWDRQVYFELGIIRLLILAVCISFSVFLLDFLVVTVVYAVFEKKMENKINISDIIMITLGVANIEIYVLLIYKLYNESCTVLQFVYAVFFGAISLGITLTIQNLFKLLRQKRKK